MPDTWEQSVEHLYHVFSRYSLRDIRLCSHCYPEAEQNKIRELLQTPPLRKFPEINTDLGYVIWDLPYMKGQKNNYKYFLPRLLELTLTKKPRYEHIDLLARQFTYLDWRDWPTVEQETVLNVLETAWKEGVSGSLADEWGAGDIIDLLIAFDHLGGSAKALLEFWDNSSTFEAGYQLANLVYYDLHTVIDSDQRSNTRWRDSLAVKELLKHWLLRDKTSQKLEAIYLDHSDEDGSERISDAVNILSIITVKE
jgi:hypothetical protein